MSDLDLVAQLAHTTARLNVSLFVAVCDQLTRGGFAASTRPDPSRARNPNGFPELDRIDRAVIVWRQSHTDGLRAALTALLELEQLERRVIPPSPALEPDRYDLWFTEMSKQAEMDHKAPSVKCANCERWVLQTPSDKLRSGRCSACAMWRTRHGGQERPADQWEQQNA